MKISIYFYLITCFSATQVMSDDFCATEGEVENIFSISDSIYLLKNSIFYKFKDGTSLINNNGSNVNDFFHFDIISVFTGFQITLIPDCNSSDANYCKDMEKLKGISFVIVNKTGSQNQKYVAYKVDDNQNLNPITDNSLMPFNMKTEAEIDVGVFWPLKAEDNKVIYRMSAFVESRFEIVLIIGNSGATKELTVYWTSLDRPNWATNWSKEEPKMFDLKYPKPELFYGLFSSNVSKNRGPNYALVKYGSDKKQTLLSYKGNATFFEETQNEGQNLFDVRKEIYRCVESTTGPTAETPNKETLTDTTTTQSKTTTKQKSSEGLGVTTIIILIVVVVIIVLVAFVFSYAYYKYGSKQPKSQPKEPEVALKEPEVVPKEPEIVPKEPEVVPKEPKIVLSEQPTKELPQEANKENFDQLSVVSIRSHETVYN